MEHRHDTGSAILNAVADLIAAAIAIAVYLYAFALIVALAKFFWTHT